jgi:hypothetical protein
VAERTVLHCINTEKFEVLIHEGNHGYFEHHTRGDECAGELIFDGKELVDYDGVFALPHEVCAALRELGYVVDEDCEED